LTAAFAAVCVVAFVFGDATFGLVAAIAALFSLSLSLSCSTSRSRHRSRDRGRLAEWQEQRI